MDLQLPGIDGAEALRRIRAERPRAAACPVVAVTAFAMDDDRERAFDSGFDGYVQKPISVRALPHQVRDFLELGGSDVNDGTPPSATVLAVDDHPANLRLLDAILTPARLRRPRGGVRARRPSSAIAETDVDLVLLDIVMPGHRRLRGVPAHPRATRDGVPARWSW